MTLAALLVLILVSNNRPARTRLWIPVSRRRPMGAIRVEQLPVPIYRPPRWWERLAAATGLTVVSAVVGAVLATIVAGVLIYAVTTLTGMLK
ncbi:MAG: hypothetical protein R2705_20085 [Ilumatobacteraceae bacterium]